MEQLVASRIIGQDHRHFLAVLLLLAVWLGSQFQASAQQQYNNQTGYVCSDSGEKSCNTFALYRAQGNYSTVPQIAELFNTSETEVAKLSNLPPGNQPLSVGQAVIIPVTCHCGVNLTSFANISYTVVNGDTIYEINLNKFESLSTIDEIEAVNSINSSLDIGEQITFPLRCACPSKAQISKGVKSLVTYPVGQDDTVDAIASSFGVSAEDVINGNTAADNLNLIYANTSTLLIPINSSQPHYTTEASSSLLPASSASSPAQRLVVRTMAVAAAASAFLMHMLKFVSGNVEVCIRFP